jgi:hypothetical protein
MAQFRGHLLTRKLGRFKVLLRASHKLPQDGSTNMGQTIRACAHHRVPAYHFKSSIHIPLNQLAVSLQLLGIPKPLLILLPVLRMEARVRTAHKLGWRMSRHNPCRAPLEAHDLRVF